MGRRAEALLLALILGAYLVVATLYAARVPPYNAPDEPAHANYVREIAWRGALPVLRPGDWDAGLLERLKAARFPAGSDVSTIRYESHQPPLFYLLLAPLARATAGASERGQIVALRLGSVAIGLVALAALYLAARTLIQCDRATALLALALAAFVPQHVATLASVSNDGLAELWLSLLLWLGALALRGGVTNRGAAALGLVSGLGMLTKLSAWIGAPLAGLALLIAPTRSGRRSTHLLISGAVAVALVLPWVVRGALVYGADDPFGLRRHDEVVEGQPLTGRPGLREVVGMGTTLFRSFWGQFGWMGVLMDERVYLALALLSALIGLGLVLWLAPWGGLWRDGDGVVRRGYLLAGGLVAAVLVATLVYNLRFLQPQGRYLFPAMAGLAPLAALGLRELFAPRQRAAVYALLAVGLVGLDLVALFRFILPDLVR
ncbi:MAG TPA: glycosyltransferase family 39 protein [Chloroflexota bacterium]|jgi:4-amino-4-deoxy-L-arabinose transferase-like glycosyltransferase|nr:glycosyltransferase family 39 protein [Chloroflexota bacterium]